MTGCYLTLTASGDGRLIAMGAPLARTALVHEMKVEGGMMRMAELKDSVVLPAGHSVQQKPGGNHLVLIGLTQPLTEGEQTSITQTVAPVQPRGMPAPVAPPPLVAASPATR